MSELKSLKFCDGSLEWQFSPPKSALLSTQDNARCRNIWLRVNFRPDCRVPYYDQRWDTVWLWTVHLQPYWCECTIIKVNRKICSEIVHNRNQFRSSECWVTRNGRLRDYPHCAGSSSNAIDYENLPEQLTVWKLGNQADEVAVGEAVCDPIWDASTGPVGRTRADSTDATVDVVNSVLLRARLPFRWVACPIVNELC